MMVQGEESFEKFVKLIFNSEMTDTANDIAQKIIKDMGKNETLQINTLLHDMKQVIECTEKLYKKQQSQSTQTDTSKDSEVKATEPRRKKSESVRNAIAEHINNVNIQDKSAIPRVNIPSAFGKITSVYGEKTHPLKHEIHEKKTNDYVTNFLNERQNSTPANTKWKEVNLDLVRKNKREGKPAYRVESTGDTGTISGISFPNSDTTVEITNIKGKETFPDLATLNPMSDVDKKLTKFNDSMRIIGDLQEVYKEELVNSDNLRTRYIIKALCESLESSNNLIHLLVMNTDPKLQ